MREIIILMVNKTNLTYKKTEVAKGLIKAGDMISDKFVGSEFHQGSRVNFRLIY